MYEPYNGPRRLVGSIERRVEDPEFVEALAELLYYVPEQLVQDIHALNDMLAADDEKRQ